MTDAADPAAAADGRRPDRGSRLHALLETLRAPLLLSPVADVLAGVLVTRAALGASVPGAELPGGPRLAAEVVPALLAGSCLLAAGMAQNALVDREDDRRRKPERPIPRGAVTVATVRVTWVVLTLGAVACAVWRPALAPAVAGVLALSALYHHVLGRWRVPGALALGAARALDMGLGILAATPAAATSVTASWLPWGVAAGYGLMITGASLHASTDDEAGGAGWSRLGLGVAQATLIAGAAAAATLGLGLAGGPHRWALASVPLWAWAVVRLHRARVRLPPPAITGVALSNLYVVHAALVLAAGSPLLAALVLGLLAVSRRLLRRFPPS